MLHTDIVKHARLLGPFAGSLWLLAIAAIACDAASGAKEGGGSLDDASAEAPSLAFEGLRIEDLASERAVLRFTTSRPTSCEAQYGPTPELGLTATDPEMEEGEVAVEHEVPLEDLTADTQYHVRARAEDESGHVFHSDAIAFRTLSAAPAGVGQNVALLTQGARVVAVSSNFGGGPDDGPWGANAAFDGQMNSEWSSAGDGDDAFVDIDLGQPRTLIAFGFRSRKMSDGSSIIRSVQLVLDESRTLGPFATPDPDQHYRLEFAPQDATRVRIEAVESTGGNTGAKEIELYAP